MRLTIVAVSALALLSTPAVAAPFCDGLKAIAAAGAEGDPFKSLRGAKGDFDFAGTLKLPGFQNCRTSAGMSPTYSCHRMKLTAATAPAVEAQAKADVEACFGGTMARDGNRSLKPYILYPKGGRAPILLVNNIGGEMVTVSYIMK